MKKKSDILNLRFKKYILDITEKKLGTLVPIAILLLLLLTFSDIFIRHSIMAVYTRLFSLGLAVFLYLRNKIRPGASVNKIVLYNIFLASLPAMMFAKYLVHHGTGTDMINIISIIVAFFVLLLEVRANTFITLIIFLVPTVLFGFILFYFFPVTNKELLSLLNVLIVLIISFFINRVQNKLRFKTYVSNFLLNVEKKKLEESNEALKQYKNKLEDMVEKKTLSLKYALERAKESDALKTQFLLNISHELRTPMNAILGFGNILSRKNPDMKKEIEIIETNLTGLLETIENIILLSKLQSEQAGLELSKFSANEFNKELFNRLKTKVKKSNKPISVKFDNQLTNDLLLYSDKKKLKIIFKQITDNAVKYTEQGEIKLTCKISENNLFYSIADTGIGISSNELPHIFDPFRKIEKSDKLYSGTGIGLSIAKGLTTLLKGNISIKSNRNKGTTVLLTIPLSV